MVFGGGDLEMFVEKRPKVKTTSKKCSIFSYRAFFVSPYQNTPSAENILMGNKNRFQMRYVAISSEIILNSENSLIESHWALAAFPL